MKTVILDINKKVNVWFHYGLDINEIGVCNNPEPQIPCKHCGKLKGEHNNVDIEDVEYWFCDDTLDKWFETAPDKVKR